MKNIAYFSVIAFITVLLLIYGKTLLLPLFFALFIWIIGRGFRAGLDKGEFIQEKLPGWLKNIIVLGLIYLCLEVSVRMFSSGITELLGAYENYAGNIQILTDKVDKIFDISIFESIRDSLANLNIQGLLNDFLGTLSSVFSNSFLVFIYILFISLERINFNKKLKKIFSKKEDYNNIFHILEEVEASIFKYLKLKTFVSLLTGCLSFLVLWFIGVDAPIFWAFLIFLLNYIPTIGSLIATVFPVLFALIQFGSFLPSILVLLLVGGIQVLVGNILEPRIMGKSLNVSPLVALFSLAFWGNLWGIPGMLLSVPIMVIVVIILSQFKQTRSVAIMLSENGDINKL